MMVLRKIRLKVSAFSFISANVTDEGSCAPSPKISFLMLLLLGLNCLKRQRFVMFLFVTGLGRNNNRLFECNNLILSIVKDTKTHPT